MTHYEILGISPTATAEEIEKAYRALARQHHPDRNIGDKTAAERFISVQNAYDVLSDPKRKLQYDLTLPKPKPKYKTKAERDAEAYAAYRAEVARGFTVSDAPPPKFDLWGQPIGSNNKEPDFIDAYANTYTPDDVIPYIR